jgi:chromosomal replication initiator protein
MTNPFKGGWAHTAVTPKVRDAAIAEASAAFGVPDYEISGRCVRRVVAHARQYAMWRVRQHRDAGGQPLHSFPAIGAAFGVNHTTVLHADQRVEARLSAGKLFPPHNSQAEPMGNVAKRASIAP